MKAPNQPHRKKHRLMQASKNAEFSPKLQDYLETLKPSKWGSSETNPISSKNFMWVTVAHFPMPNPQAYFEQAFLTPLDRVLAWVPRPEARSEKVKADVMLDLGSDKIPPRKPSTDRQIQNLEYMMKHNRGLKLIEAEKEELTERLAREGKNVSPETQRFKESLERAIQMYEEKRKDFQEMIESMKRERRFEVWWDPVSMTCVIEFSSNQFCLICRTTHHSLYRCAAKGCSLCLDKHPLYRCPEKCKCARRPVHLAATCPSKQAPKPFSQTPKLSTPEPHGYSPGKRSAWD